MLEIQYIIENWTPGGGGGGGVNRSVHDEGGPTELRIANPKNYTSLEF